MKLRTLRRKLQLLTVLLLSAIMVFTLCGFSMNMEAVLKRNGKGSAVLTFESDKPLEEFKTELERKISDYNGVSAANTQTGGENMLVVKSVEEISDGYSVMVDFRRIDKLAVNSRFEYESLSDYLENYLTEKNSDGTEISDEDAINYRKQTLVKWNRGDLTGIMVDGLDRLIQFTDKKDSSLKVIPKDSSGNEIAIDDFIAEGKKAGGREKILTFFMLGMDELKSIQIGFPGKVTYYAGENITLVEDDTIQITPSTKQAQVRTSGDETDILNEDVSCFVGYIVYEQSISPVQIAAILIGGLALIGAAVWCYLKLFKDNKQGLKKLLHSSTWKKIVRHKQLYLLVLPAVVLFIIFNYAPMFGLAIAFQDYNASEGVFGSEFIGLAKFKEIFLDYNAYYSYKAFRNTIFISLIRIATNFPVILIAALFVNDIKAKKPRTLLTTISYIPYFISWVAVGGMTYNLFKVDGLFNQLLTALGMETVNWYATSDYWWAILVLSSLWKGLGWSTLIYVSNLGLINSELYEACRVDGGGKIRQALTVTIPGLMNVMVMQLILDVGNIMRDNYDQVKALTMGSYVLEEKTLIVGQIEFQTTISGSYTEGAVYGLVRGIVGLLLVLMTNKLAKSVDSEGIL